MLLEKNKDGSFPILSLLMFSPYLYFVRGFSALRRLKSREAPYSEVSKGLYVGGWPSSPDKMSSGNPAVIDCTCHGRSMALMSALLVGLGVVDDWKNGEKLIKEKRSYIRMSALHWKALEELSMNRLSPPKNGSNARY
ncbi:unnamed protein product [Lactuca virosa]|uniref:Uncharacterized protein n=1 Tax=Lactuca virosa TaxID=75947 RepID=A0AAU9MR56_9ASTR|nr:unnamed protein product [Lactuca virosa]